MKIRTAIASACLAFAMVGTSAALAHDNTRAPAVEPAAGDVSGTYTWEQQGGGGNAQTTTLVLKQEGGKLSGTISGRQGDTPIEEGTVDGGTIKFMVTRDWNGTKMVTEYSGSITGADLKLTITTMREVSGKKSA